MGRRVVEDLHAGQHCRFEYGFLGNRRDACLVLARLAEHGGQVIQRANGDGADGHPDEVQILRFASAAALDAYLADPRRMTLADERERIVERTEVFPVDLI